MGELRYLGKIVRLFFDPDYPMYMDYRDAPEVVEESGYEYMFDDYDEFRPDMRDEHWGHHIGAMEERGWEYIYSVVWGHKDHDWGEDGIHTSLNIETLWRRKLTDEKRRKRELLNTVRRYGIQ